MYEIGEVHKVDNERQQIEKHHNVVHTVAELVSALKELDDPPCQDHCDIADIGFLDLLRFDYLSDDPVCILLLAQELYLDCLEV